MKRKRCSQERIIFNRVSWTIVITFLSFYLYLLTIAKLVITATVTNHVPECHSPFADRTTSNSEACLTVRIRDASIVHVAIGSYFPIQLHAFGINLTDSAGHRIKATREAGFTPDDSGNFEYSPEFINPYATWFDNVDLASEYKLKPGTYTVTVSDSAVVELYVPFFLFPPIHGRPSTVTFTVPE